MRRSLRALLAFAALLAGATALSGESRPTPLALGDAAAFRPAPLFGADIRSLVFDPREPARAFAGSSAGHVYRSDDGGERWGNAGLEVPFPGWVVGTLAFDPNRPGRLWAGVWGIWGGGLVAFSDDLGARWTVRREGLLEGDQIYALALVPGVADRLFAGTRSGVWTSDDAGLHWRLTSIATPDLVHVSSLHVDAGDPRIVVAGTWRRAWRSDDGGATWRGVFDGMVLDTEVFSLHAVPGRAGELWASTCGWVYHGERSGERWVRTKAGFSERRTPSFDVLSPERLLAGTVGGLHLSTDAGASFRPVGPPELAVLAIAHHPARPERVLVGTEGAGIWISTDGGETLAPRPVATINVRVPSLAATGDAVFAALSHAGLFSGLYRSPNGGVSFEPLPERLPTVLDLAVHGGRVFAATERGLFERSGTVWTRVAELAERRIAQLATDGTRLVAREGPPSGSRLWELDPDGARFRELALPLAAAPRAIALADGVLWALAGDGLHRVGPGGAPEVAALPFPGGELVASAGALFYAGDAGLFSFDRASGWVQLARERSRAAATGDARFPAVARVGAHLVLLDRDRQRLVPLDAPFAAADLLSALTVGGRLLLGSSGYGLWERPLPE